ncbi:MAG: hypothetical protein JO314_10255, partial [Acidobacteria bacterium]|nr:hypothetical protein [Acidobacteriota bacterium]
RFYAPASVGRWRGVALGIGGIALLAWAVGLYFNSEQALRSWLLGFVFWGGIAIGSLGVLMLQYLTGGAWGVVIRRGLEAAARTMPLLFLFFVPLAVGVYTGRIYEWTHLPATDPVMIQRGIFMTPAMWILRGFVFIIIFWVMSWVLNRWSLMQDATTDVESSRLLLERASRFSGPATVFFCIFVTFAAVDWVMTLEPHWFSTIWGLLYVVGWALSCLCFMVAIMALLIDQAPMDGVLGRRHFHDLGKLMLALVMVWAYFNFSQYLIVWSGNIPEETVWFITRTSGGWGWIGAFLLFFHFAFPFLVLLQQDFKRRAKWLAAIALFILLMRLVDMFWHIGPSPRVTGDLPLGAFHIDWLDFAAPIAIGGVWLWWFFGQLAKRPLVPVRDPYFKGAVEHGHGH